MAVPIKDNPIQSYHAGFRQQQDKGSAGLTT